MNIAEFLSSPMAIMPEKLLEIQAVYAAHFRGDKIDIEAIEARLGKQLANQEQGYQNVGGVAVIPVGGVIGKKMNMMTQISGGASTQMIERDIKNALQDPEIDSILLHIDSPGGTVDGTQNLSDVVAMAATIKPVVSFADGLMASAAYWFGSAADQIVASSSTTQIGSIGVRTSHVDVSKANAEAGITVTDIYAGKYKAIASENAPLSKAGKTYMQDQVDQLYTIFVDAVAINRGVSSEKVLSDMADAKIFLAGDAQKAGLIDHIATLETTISNMQTGVWPMATKKEAQVAEPVASQDITIKQEVTVMDIETLKKDHAALVSALMAEGAQCERDRIAGCEAALLPGHEALVEAMKLDGKSTGADVAMAVINAEKVSRANHLKDFQSNAPAPVVFAAVEAVEKVVAEDDKSLPVEDRAKAKWDSDAQVRSEFTSLQAFTGFFKAAEAGNVKIHSKTH